MTVKRSGKVLEHAVRWAKLEENLHSHVNGERFPLSKPVKPNPKATAFSTLCTRRHCLFLQYDGVRKRERERERGTRTNFRPALSSVLHVIKALKLLKMKEELHGTWRSGVLPPTVLLILRTAAKIFIYRQVKREKWDSEQTRRPESLPCAQNSASFQRCSTDVSLFS
jgi:hypothetical protein